MVKLTWTNINKCFTNIIHYKSNVVHKCWQMEPYCKVLPIH